MRNSDWYLPIVVINVIEYKNADAYVHLCGFIDGWTPVCWIFVARTERKSISCIVNEKKKEQLKYDHQKKRKRCKWWQKKMEFPNKY